MTSNNIWNRGADAINCRGRRGAEWEEFVQQRDGAAGVMEAVLIANRARIQVLVVDYGMPPAHPFPAAVDDAVAVYRHMLENRPAGSIALGGTSAGDGLTLATVQKLIELGDIPLEHLK